MLSSITATGALAAAAEWGSNLTGPVLIVIGFGVGLAMLSWVVAKFRRRGGKKRKK
jgi:hypothetical protein